jgi:ribosomal protein S21
MLKVEIGKNQSLEKALKTLKGKVIKTKQNEMLREKIQYTKKCVKKRQLLQAAKYKQFLNSKND